MKIESKYIIDKEAEKQIIIYLNGEITCRELGKKLECSHQQAINLVASICRQWYQEGKLSFKEKSEVQLV